VRRACIDIGSNTTRLLVADCNGSGISEVHQERVFTRISRGLLAGGRIPESKIAEVADVVAAQLGVARALGAAQVIALATAAVRRAANGGELTAAVQSGCGLEITVLTEQEEARLAFIGAAGMLSRAPAGSLGVVDVGGGSSELIVGQIPQKVDWSTSVAVGSGDLADGFLQSDPPKPSELEQARQHVVQAFLGVDVPRTRLAVAVGGSATSVRRLAGGLLNEAAFSETLELLGSTTAAEVALRFGLDRERVRLLPAGLLILQAAAQRFGTPLVIGYGGLREGALLEAAG
jgi:exopolyphosphatase / guanosine-5'-triphosphate,3'-diphosphate pyrophosphatase